jgi:hypothetical protein
MVIIHDMATGKIHETAAADTEYGMEVMCSGWNPSVEALHEALASHTPQTERETARSMPADLLDVAPETFLDDM